MKISTRVRYGVRMMLQLALERERGYVFLKDIAQHEGISEKYLSQIVIPLRAHGLVRSSRGAKGGYMLARAPGAITVQEVVEALNGPLAVVACEREPLSCKRSARCVTRRVWQRVTRGIVDVLGSTTLQDLLNEHAQLTQNAVNYEI